MKNGYCWSSGLGPLLLGRVTMRRLWARLLLRKVLFKKKSLEQLAGCTARYEVKAQGESSEQAGSKGQLISE